MLSAKSHSNHAMPWPPLPLATDNSGELSSAARAPVPDLPPLPSLPDVPPAVAPPLAPPVPELMPSPMLLLLPSPPLPPGVPSSMRSAGTETGVPGSVGLLGLDDRVVGVTPGNVVCGSVGNVGNVTGGTVGGVTIAPVTVKVWGEYANDRPSLTHTAATATGAAGVALGIENEPCHEPLEATEGWITV